MRKRVIDAAAQQNVTPDEHWLDIENLAAVEISSEDDRFPIESALLPGNEAGWRAADAGEQIIRLVFDTPLKIQRIKLNFEEFEVERTHEYVLRCASDGGQAVQEIVRQQWNFSPEGATSEVADYQVDLPAVTSLELSINPDINNSNAYASLKMLRVA